MRIKEIDDLELVPCMYCDHGRIGREKCDRCNGTGDRVIHETKYYELPRRQR